MPAALPTGTVTFLFTDIEGSTDLLRRLGDDVYRRAQDDQAAIIRDSVTAHEGVEVRTEGDAFFVAFASANAAVRTAVDAQRALAAHRWPEGCAIRVRMGMHTGEGTLGGDDYLGVDVNRAARVASSGHGGQVVLSDATRAIVAESLPDGTSVRALGRHRLKGFEDPTPLHDLLIDDLPAEFPPLRSLERRRTNLRAPRTSLVGRDDEMMVTLDALDRGRLVTLTGPGGTGKTRLALEVATRWLDRDQDEVYLVDLSAVHDPTLILSEIAAVLRVRDDPGHELATSVHAYLRERSVLLVLDNLEQLVEGVDVVGTAIDAVPRLRVLATSRTPLHLAGEREIAIDPLTLPADGSDLEALAGSDAIRLFEERAAAVRSGFRVDGGNAEAVGRVVAKLDGLPLALELGASQLRVLALDDLAARLERRLPLPTPGPRDAPERQRTLESTIAWSYDALDEPDRDLFERLAVFSGGWTLQAAEALAGDGSDVFAGLGSLIEHSLVRLVGGASGARYAMLETIRAFAAARLEERPAAERSALDRAHAAWFRAFAEAAEPHLTGDRQVEWVASLTDEHDNLRAVFTRAELADDPAMTEDALRTAASIWRLWHAKGSLIEGGARLERLLSLPSASPRDAARARALGALGSIEYWLNDFGPMQAHYEEQVEIARAVGDRHLLAAALFNASFVHVANGDLSAHVAAAEEALAVVDPDDLRLLAQIWGNIGFSRMMRGDAAGAIEPIERAIEYARASDDRLELCEGLMARSAVPFLMGDLDEAAGWLREAVEVAVSAPTPQVLSRAVFPLALLANGRGRFDRAATLLGISSRFADDYDVHFPEAGLRVIGDPTPTVRAALGDEAFERAFADGRSMTEAEVVAFIAADG